MNRILEKMLKCQPGQAIIQEEGKKVAGYINYVDRARGVSPLEMDTLQMRILGLTMTVLSWEGRTDVVTSTLADEYMEDFLSLIGEEAEYVLADRDVHCTVRIFWQKEFKDALIAWGDSDFTAMIGRAYHRNGLEYAQDIADGYITDEPLKKESVVVENNTVIGDNYGNVGGSNNTVFNTKNDLTEFLSAMSMIRGLADTIPVDERSEFIENVDFVTDEVQRDQPKTSLLKRSWETIKRIGSSQLFKKAIETAAPYVMKKLIGG